MPHSTKGAIRKVDELGRVVLPLVIRKELGIQCGHDIEIVVDGSQIVIRKATATCSLYEDMGKLIEFENN